MKSYVRAAFCILIVLKPSETGFCIHSIENKGEQHNLCIEYINKLSEYTKDIKEKVFLDEERHNFGSRFSHFVFSVVRCLPHTMTAAAVAMGNVNRTTHCHDHYDEFTGFKLQDLFCSKYRVIDIWNATKSLLIRFFSC